MANQVVMTPGVVRGEEVIEYPTDVIHLRGVGHGNVQVIEYFSTDREGSPRHAHQWDEIEIVVDGVVEFTVGNGTFTGGSGTVQFLPAGVPHSVRVPEGEARIIYVTSGPRTTVSPVTSPDCCERGRRSKKSSPPRPGTG